jgi:membrane associated rhomboid family serine protease
MSSSETAQVFASELFFRARMLIGFVVALWFLGLVNIALLGKSLNTLGIRPRTVSGLAGILLAPLLHGSVKHLLGNTSAFLILGGLLLLEGVETFWIVTAIATLTGGLGIWLLGGKNTNHIGASGIIFGYLGFLILRGYFTREIFSTLISLLVFLYYGSLLWRILPLGGRFSWEGHLFGFLGGALTARFLETIRASLPENFLWE